MKIGRVRKERDLFHPTQKELRTSALLHLGTRNGCRSDRESSLHTRGSCRTARHRRDTLQVQGL